jgi:hypothetical protein
MRPYRIHISRFLRGNLTLMITNYSAIFWYVTVYFFPQVFAFLSEVKKRMSPQRGWIIKILVRAHKSNTTVRTTHPELDRQLLLCTTLAAEVEDDDGDDVQVQQLFTHL